MKRTLIVGGSLGAVVLLVLAMFPSVVEARNVVTDPNTFIQNFVDKTHKNNKKRCLDYNFLDIWELLFILSQLIFGILALIFMHLPR